MKVAFGLKAHSGWAALVVLGVNRNSLELVDRRRIELVEEEWAKQPYHAAEELDLSEGRAVVKRGVTAAHKNAGRVVKEALNRAQALGCQIVACSILVGEPMPDWTVDEILAVHFRMHKAEGVLFREALAGAATNCGLQVVRVPEKQLTDFAQRQLKGRFKNTVTQLNALGKEAGAPWGKDQKDAALAAAIPLLS